MVKLGLQDYLAKSNNVLLIVFISNLYSTLELLLTRAARILGLPL